MITIEAHGDVMADNDQYAMLYDWLGIPRISENLVRSQLATDPTDDVTVNLSSDGGDVFTASDIYTMLRAHKGHVTVNITGLAASAGSVIAMAGDTVNISPTGALMIHRAATVAQGNRDAMDQATKMLDQIDQTIIPAYEAKTGMKHDELLNLMVQETWITAKQAVDWGFADAQMFDGDSKQQFAASVGTRSVPTAALDKLKAMFDKQQTPPVPTPPVPEPKNEEPEEKPTLRQRKLAILMHSEKEYENATN